MDKNEFEKLMYEDKAWWLFRQVRSLINARDNAWNNIDSITKRVADLERKYTFNRDDILALQQMHKGHPQHIVDSESELETVTIPYREYMRLMRGIGPRR